MRCPECKSRSIVRVEGDDVFRVCKKWRHRFAFNHQQERPNHWSEEEEAQLRVYKAEGLENAEIGKLLGRPRQNVNNKWWELHHKRDRSDRVCQ